MRPAAAVADEAEIWRAGNAADVSCRMRSWRWRKTHLLVISEKQCQRKFAHRDCWGDKAIRRVVLFGSFFRGGC